ncbi:MAG: DUF6132 family protein [Candidatus Saccharibacteria bacterium]
MKQLKNNIENKQGRRNSLFSSWRFWRPFLSIFIGALAGYLYYHFVGCTSGQCSITSDPAMSTIWGGMLGFFLVNSPCSRNSCRID